MKLKFSAAFIVLLVVAVFLAVTPVMYAQAPSPGVAYSNLVQVNNSGIQGQLRFTDTPTALRTYSSAPVSGFNPQKAYVTLVYGLNSRGPGEAAPICGRDTQLGFDQMFIGAWTYPGSGTRSLDVTKLHTLFVQVLGTPIAQAVPGGVKLSQARTVSIREFNPPPGSSPSTDPAALVSFLVQWATGDIPPSTFQLRSCGFIVPGNPAS